MTDEELKFLSDGIALEGSAKLADLAHELFGESAAPMLMGAALKVWEKQMGKDHAFEMAKRALKAIVEEEGNPTRYQ